MTEQALPTPTGRRAALSHHERTATSSDGAPRPALAADDQHLSERPIIGLLVRPRDAAVTSRCAAREQDQLCMARPRQDCPSHGIAGAGRLFGLAAHGRPQQALAGGVANVADRLLETDMGCVQLTI